MRERATDRQGTRERQRDGRCAGELMRVREVRPAADREASTRRLIAGPRAPRLETAVLSYFSAPTWASRRARQFVTRDLCFSKIFLTLKKQLPFSKNLHSATLIPNMKNIKLLEKFINLWKNATIRILLLLL